MLKVVLIIIMVLVIFVMGFMVGVYSLFILME